nr:hypothetical protein BaRGS_005691 [Batillaria attramentaria]
MGDFKCEEVRPTVSLHWDDVLTVVLFYIVVLAVGVWATVRARKRSDPRGYFLAGKSMTFFPVYTMPEYIRRRYGRERLRTYLSFLSILLYVITKISVEMYAGAVFVQILFGWNMYLSGVMVLSFSALFTMTGGLTAVIFTNTLQTIVLAIGAFVLMGISLDKVGGYDSLKEKYMQAVPTINTNLTLANSTCGQPRADAFSLMRDPLTSDYPWIVVQRALSAKSLSHAKGGSIVAGYLKILPFFMFIVPGLAARILYPDEVACVDPAVCQCICDNPNGCSNIAYALLVLRVLHPGLRGLMLAALFAAVMSSLTSVFNSASSIFTMDLWRRFRSHATQLELLVVGRLVVLVMVGLSVMWIPIMSAAQGDELWQYWQMLQSAVGPPWGMVFIFGIFWKRTTEPAVGISRLILTFIYPAPRCGEPDMRHAFLKIHFLYVAAMQIAVCGVLMIVISLLTSPRPPRKKRPKNA